MNPSDAAALDTNAICYKYLDEYEFEYYNNNNNNNQYVFSANYYGNEVFRFATLVVYPNMSLTRDESVKFCNSQAWGNNNNESWAWGIVDPSWASVAEDAPALVLAAQVPLAPTGQPYKFWSGDSRVAFQRQILLLGHNTGLTLDQSRRRHDMVQERAAPKSP